MRGGLSLSRGDWMLSLEKKLNDIYESYCYGNNSYYNTHRQASEMAEFIKDNFKSFARLLKEKEPNYMDYYRVPGMATYLKLSPDKKYIHFNTGWPNIQEKLVSESSCDEYDSEN